MKKMNVISEALAAEIRAQDWSDAHSRLDGSRHHRNRTSEKAEQLDPEAADRILINVVWVTGQALLELDPNFDIRTFAIACGVPEWFLLKKDGRKSRGLEYGMRERLADEDPS